MIYLFCRCLQYGIRFSLPFQMSRDSHNFENSFLDSLLGLLLLSAIQFKTNPQTGQIQMMNAYSFAAGKCASTALFFFSLA